MFALVDIINTDLEFIRFNSGSTDNFQNGYAFLRYKLLSLSDNSYIVVGYNELLNYLPYCIGFYESDYTFLFKFDSFSIQLLNIIENAPIRRKSGIGFYKYLDNKYNIVKEEFDADQRKLSNKYSYEYFNNKCYGIEESIINLKEDKPNNKFRIIKSKNGFIVVLCVYDDGVATNNDLNMIIELKGYNPILFSYYYKLLAKLNIDLSNCESFFLVVQSGVHSILAAYEFEINDKVIKLLTKYKVLMKNK